MKMQCQGGGRAGKITCWHTFAGIALDPDGTSGAVTASAKAATAYATATVTAFSATWYGEGMEWGRVWLGSKHHRVEDVKRARRTKGIGRQAWMQRTEI